MPATLAREKAVAPDAATLTNEVTWPRLTLAVVIAASGLRLWLALDDHSIYWPDEIYQSLEQAHRLAFGSGLIPWEFRDGARNWILPGAIAGLWRLAALLGVKSSIVLVSLARCAVVLAGAAALWCSARLAARLASARAGFVAALVLALLPASVVFGYRTLSESLSAPLVVAGALLLIGPTPRQAMLAGACITLATLLRYQNALLGLCFLLWLVAERRFRDVLWFSAAGAVTLLLGGLLDQLTWGRLFHSLLAYVDFNLLRGGASTFGVEPFWYYAKSLWTGTGPALIAFVPLAIAGAVRAPAIGLAVLAYLVAHSFIPHKELRFIVPVLPLACVLVGVGAERLFRRAPRENRWWALGLGAATLAMAVHLPHLTYRQMGQYLDVPRGTRTVWHADEETNLLLAKAGEQADLCGLGVLGLRPAFTGGYTYFHRTEPLIFARQLCGEESAVNYVIAPFYLANSLVPPRYTLVEERSWLGLFRRKGACEASATPADLSLDGAHDMGLNRQVAEQSQDGSVRVDLLRDAGSFVSGWGNGEVLDCKPARWLVGSHAVLQFRAGPLDWSLMLRAKVRAFDGGTAQHLRASFNGQVVYEAELPTTSTLIKADLPRLGLGLNQLSLDVTSAWKPAGDDVRELAALLESFELTPLSDDFSIELNSSPDPEHFVSGFGKPEMEGRQTFVWSDGPVSTIQGRLYAPTKAHLLSFTAEAIEGTTGRTRVSVNGHPAKTVTLTREWALRQILVPSEFLERGLNRVSFQYESTVIPAAIYPGSNDRRELAVRFESFVLEPVPPSATIDVGTPQARSQMLDGWSNDETEEGRSVAWTDGPRARAKVWLEGSHDAQLRVDARAYPFALPLEVEVRLNDNVVGSFHPGALWASHELTLPARLFSEEANIIELRFDHSARPSEHEAGSQDKRELALRVDRLTVVR